VDKLEQLFYTVKDPETTFPAMTTLLYKVCGQDQAKFEEACRLIRLFMIAAKEQE
jgi:hypothetical protein